MKIAVVTCYKHNDYVRARTLRAAVTACPGVDMTVIRNRHKGVLRYPEVALKICRARLFDRPDAYVITFRGYEILLFLRLALVRKPIVFDELVNFTEWMVEHGRLSDGSLPFRLFRHWNAWLVRRCRFILADTSAHAKYSAILNTLSISRYRTVPVCADESVFQPQTGRRAENKTFTVLYYGNMLALHGLDYVLQAAELLKDRPDIQFRLVGGKSKVTRACAQAAAAGARVSHQAWVPFEALPGMIRDAGLVLGGPFGDTIQSRYIVTGKTYQALACGGAVLIGKNQVHEGFHDKKNCLMVPQADPAALAEAIRWASEHPAQLKEIGQAGRELYEAHFSQAEVNKLVRKIVEEL